MFTKVKFSILDLILILDNNFIFISKLLLH